MVLLQVNVDHVATLRQARRGRDPDPVLAAQLAELYGADGITIHLRGDRRHIQVDDLERMRRSIRSRLNLELATTEELLAIALRVQPDQVTLVPERPDEITTEGGLDVAEHLGEIGAACQRLKRAGIAASLFIDPELAQVDAAALAGAGQVELNTLRYAARWGSPDLAGELDKVRAAADRAVAHGLRLAAGHDLNYVNVIPIARIPRMEELNIGHAILARAVLVGLERAVRDMKALLAG
jgi:pyridoxine 5-phosphate synthase